MDNIWVFKKYDQLLTREISKHLGISITTASLLVQRGITSPAEAENFLYGKPEDLTDPFLLPGIAGAVKRIERAVADGEDVVVYGDYDVDGICSTVLLKECLDILGCRADYYVPDRFGEGYGLNISAIEILAARGYKLLISVDCGITSVEEIKRAVRLGMDVIITDHHTPKDQLPPATEIINPKLGSYNNSYHLAGVGVVFQLVRALCYGKLSDEQVFTWLDLVALATVADIVPVLGDNRILVKYGIKKLLHTGRIGLKALISECGLEGKHLSSWHIGFILAPRLNSAGRLDNARTSIELLLCREPDQARELAVELCRLNNNRRVIEEEILADSILQVETTINLEKEPVLILAGEGWHQGVIGIVASRLAAKYNRPVILISWEGVTGKGSGRSSGDFNLYEALTSCEECLLQFGGHPMAAGLSIEKARFEEFKSKMGEWAEIHNIQGLLPKKYSIDAEIEYDDINYQLLSELELLQPYGEGNQSPCLALKAGQILAPALVGKDKNHIKFKLGNRSLDAIAFNQASGLDLPWRQCCHDIAFELQENEFRGHKNIQLKVKDLKCSFIPDNGLVREYTTPTINHIAGNISRELKGNRPVLIIYPAYRSLLKHQMVIRTFFTPEMIIPMHGKMSIEARNRAEDQLRAGSAKVFLITQSFFRYYQKKYHLPANLGYIAMIWPQPENKDEENLRNKYVVEILPNRELACGPRWVKTEWDFTDTRRTFIYANRNRTIEKINNLHTVNIEAGISSWQTRKTVRTQFLSSKAGALLSDGNCMYGLPPIDNVDELVFADVPYGSYEISSMLEQLAAARDVETYMLFERQDFKFNQNYLNKIYPDILVIKQVWLYFKKTGLNRLTRDISKIIEGIAESMQRQFSSMEFIPVLHILSDLGLCRVRKKGSIMEINLIEAKHPTLDISESPYYLEGIAEKRIFASLQEKLYKISVR